MTVSEVYKKHPRAIFQEYQNKAKEAQKVQDQQNQKIEDVRQSHLPSQGHLLDVAGSLRQWYEQSKSDQLTSSFVKQWMPELLSATKSVPSAMIVASEVTRDEHDPNQSTMNCNRSVEHHKTATLAVEVLSRSKKKVQLTSSLDDKKSPPKAKSVTNARKPVTAEDSHQPWTPEEESKVMKIFTIWQSGEETFTCIAQRELPSRTPQAIRIRKALLVKQGKMN